MPECAPELRVGSVGWDHDDWQGGYYPDDLPADWRLGYYANEFDCVLLTVEQWRTAPLESIEEWADWVPPEFAFWCEWDGSALASSRAQIERFQSALGAAWHGVVCAPGVPVPADVGTCLSLPAEADPSYQAICVSASEAADWRALRQRIEGLRQAAEAADGAWCFIEPAPNSPAQLQAAIQIGRLLA